MAGNPQGGGAPNANMGGQAGQSAPQFDVNHFANYLQNYRQAAAGAPSQTPGANMAAPGGGMASAAVMPQQQNQNQNSQIYSAQPYYAGPAVMPQAPQMSEPFMQAPAQTMPQAPQMSEPFMQAPAQTMPQAPQMSEPFMQAPAQTMPQVSQMSEPFMQAPQEAPRDYYSRVLQERQNAMQGMGGASQEAPQGYYARMMQARQAQGLPMPQATDARFQQNPGMLPKMGMGGRNQMGRPEVQGNPNSMPVQRSQGRIR